ncbi:MAG: Uma2 family endonuclease [Acidobacteria bacterium]|jgi:Uma2 family endonuclease|nr:Uma2 family endonuclease [Acidobacteriota bacterium]MBA4122893.1 Uma2 family endonuclease [Acidobacteriota bacterium]MBA4184953.1 Uma2 family endonuclease [Acidobacteriota bacterium]
MISETLQNALTEVRPLPIRYTVDDLECIPEDTNRYELIGGKLFVSRAPHLDHQRTVTNLIIAFGEYLKKNPIGEIFTTPGVIFSPKDAVIPDLVFATHETVKKNVAGEEEKFEGKFIAAPELMIEILSYGKQDVKRDRVFKRQLYGDYGVKEYWIIDGLFNTIEVYQLEDGGQQLVKRFEIYETIETPLLPDFSLKLSDIFRN